MKHLVFLQIQLIQQYRYIQIVLYLHIIARFKNLDYTYTKYLFKHFLYLTFTKNNAQCIHTT